MRSQPGTTGYYTTAGSVQGVPVAGLSAAGGGGGGLTGMMGADPSAGDYAMSAGWGMPPQTAMTPVSEGVLRTIMQMGPMETMDLNWDTNP